MMKRATVFAVVVFVVAACGGETPDAADTIAVHGDWTIDVYDADGELDQHHEFENALAEDGGVILASALSRTVFPQGWIVRLSPPTRQSGEVYGDSPCAVTTGASCWLVEHPGSAGGGENEFPGLVAEVVDGAVRLTGTATALNDGEITPVETYVAACDFAGCTLENAVIYPVTTKDFFDPETGTVTPIQVESGQIVQIEIVISFTSG